MTVFTNNVFIDPAGLKTWISVDEAGIFPEDVIDAMVPAGELLEYIYKDDQKFFSEQLSQAIILGKKQEGILRSGSQGTVFLRYEIDPLGKNRILLVRFSAIRSDTDASGKNDDPFEMYAAFQNMGCGVFFTDEAGNYTYANPAWIKLTGRQPESLKEKNCWLDDIAEEDKEWALNLWQLAWKNKLSFDYELRLKKKKEKENSAEWIMVNSFFFTGTAGQFHFGGTVADIYEKKKCEAEIKSVRRNFESIFNLIQEAFVIVDYDRKIVNCNKKLLDLLGYKNADEIVGYSTELIYPSQEYYTEVWQTLAVPFMKEGKYSGMIQLKRKNGNIFPARISASLLAGTTGGHYSFAISVSDVSEIVAKELAARKNEIRISELNKALDHALLVSITDRNGIITYVNEAFAEAFGYAENEIIGKTHRILNSGFHPKSFFINIWNTILSGKTWKGVIRNRLKDGSYHWTDTAIIPQFDENSNISHFIALRYDINRFFKTKYKSIVHSEDKEAQFSDEMLSGTVRTMINKNAAMENGAINLESTEGILLMQRPVFLVEKRNENDYTIRNMNAGAEKILSVERKDIVGKNSSEIKNIVLDTLVAGITRCIGMKGPDREKIIHFNTALWEAWYEIEIINRSEKDFIVVLTDLTSWIQHEGRMAARTKHVELLLREFRHRLKNNLQLFISLSSIQRHKYGTGDNGGHLIDAENRVRTIALIFEWLGREKVSDEIRIDHYTSELVHLLSATYTTEEIEIRMDVEPLKLGISTALNYGIILNELITNCYKHALSKAQKVVVRINLSKGNDGTLTLLVSDNGTEQKNNPDGNSTQEGWEIIRQLAQDMSGEVIIEKGTQGFLVKVLFKDSKR